MSDPAPPLPLHRVRVTLVLLGICLVVFVAMVATGASLFDPDIPTLLRWGANFGPEVLQGQWWRLATAMFVHIGLIHLLLNGLCLFQLGMLAELLLGSRRFAALYLLSGLSGSVVSLAVHPMTVSAGASGAIFGVAGGLVSLYARKVPTTLPSVRRGLGSVVPFVFYNLVFGLRPGIDNSAHLGGLVMGLLLGALIPAPAAPSRARDGVAFGTGVLVLGLIVFAALRLQGSLVTLSAGARLMDGETPAAAVPLLRKAAALRPDDALAHYFLGIALMRIDSTRQALPPLREAARLDSTNSNFATELGFAYYNLRQWDSAHVAFERAGRLDPHEWRSVFNAGLAWLNDYQPAQAITDFRAAQARAPDRPEPRRMLGEAYMRVDSVLAAIGVLDSVLARDSTDAIAHFYRGAAYERIGDVARATADMRVTAATTDTSADVRSLASDARHVLEHLATLARKPTRFGRDPEPLVAGLQSPPRTHLCPDLEYPPVERGTGAVGLVTIDYTVNANGLVDSGSMAIDYSDHEVFSDAVLTMLSQCSFVPAQRGGRAVSARVRQSWRVTETLSRPKR